MFPIALTDTSKRLALTLASQNLSTALKVGHLYMITANQDLYYRNDGSAATAGDASVFLPARQAGIFSAQNATVAVIGLVAGDVTVVEVSSSLK